MKRYDDIEKVIAQQKPEVQMLLNELTITRNMVEGNKGQTLSDYKNISLPVKEGDKVTRRMALFTEPLKGSDVDVPVLEGVTYDKRYFVIDAASPTGQYAVRETNRRVDNEQ